MTRGGHWFADRDEDAEPPNVWRPAIRTSVGHTAFLNVWFESPAGCEQWVREFVVGVDYYEPPPPARSVPLTWFPAADLLDPEPIPPVEFEKPNRPSMLRGRAIPPRQDATVPWEAMDPDHSDHEDWVEGAGRCFASHDHQAWLCSRFHTPWVNGVAIGSPDHNGAGCPAEKFPGANDAHP